MATPFQAQAQQRKLFYLALILGLFAGSFLLRQYLIEPQARALAIREHTRGEVELLGSVVRLSLTGLRGLVTCVLWSSAFEAQKRNQWNELELTVRALTRLQPHFIAPWLFQSWNLAYNVSVEADRPRDKYFYVARGIELLARGERQNANQPDLRWSIGFYTRHKVGKSDETNYMRSLFQLSLIPPNERDPARFWKQIDNQEPEFNYEEFEKFCSDHPQLVRRLREGIYRDNKTERSRLFTCENPTDVVQFLEDNFQVPGLYKTEPLSGPATERAWIVTTTDTLLPELERFPALPPRATAEYNDILTTQSKLGDEVDTFAVAGSWFSYAQEPLPEPDVLPGSTKPIVDRSRQRRPRHMTTLIFRNQPALAKRDVAERLQEEGWFDDEAWDATEWFRNSDEHRGRVIRVGGKPGGSWSGNAWEAAYTAWRAHGEANKLLFPSPEEEQNRRQAAERFRTRFPTGPDGRAMIPPPERMSASELADYQAYQWMEEYNFYRNVSNFAHHYNRCFVERNPETIACRKAFFLAEKYNFAGDPLLALRTYQEPQNNPAWPDQKLSPLQAWRDLVLFKNKDFRRDNSIQEFTAELHFRYLLLANRFDGQELKEKLAKASAVVPLLPVLTPEVLRGPVTASLFEVNDPEGGALIPDYIYSAVADRMRLTSRRRTQPPSESAVTPDATQKLSKDGN
ncbi:MAG: hypothetical protein SNJ75_04950 [Gemmataceae bacterium]